MRRRAGTINQCFNFGWMRLGFWSLADECLTPRKELRRLNTLKAWGLNLLYLSAYALLTPLILLRRWFRQRPLGNILQRGLGLAPKLPVDEHCIWMHAVSVGEVNLLEPLLQRLQTSHPHSKFVISTTTATGMQLAKRKYPEHLVFYFPIDFSWAVKNVLSRLRPRLLVLAELEIWPNLIRIAHDRNVPVVVINGRLSERSFRGYLRRQYLFRGTFQRLDQVVAQSVEDANRFVALGCPDARVKVSGSIKFDGALQGPKGELVEDLRQKLQLNEGDFLWVAGSTQEPEERMAAKIWLTLIKQYPQLRLVIVPRHPHRGQAIQTDLQSIGAQVRLRSENLDATSDAGEILIADTIGELKAWWELSNAAFVGGSFGDRGGQNMLEPAATGSAVCFGPNTWNFKSIVKQMLSEGVAKQVEREEDLAILMKTWVADPDIAAAMGRAAFDLVQRSTGAVERTCLSLRPYFLDASRSTHRPKKVA